MTSSGGRGMGININIDHNNAEAGATQINNVTNNFALDAEQVNRDCLRALQCPDPFRVKNQLKATKDVLLRESFEWILHDPHYLRWRDSQDVALLWIKGGAGKGKTMMSIGLVEELSRAFKLGHAPLVTYFFCQYADASLNTEAALIEGLIYHLVRERPHVVQELRARWDHTKGQFTTTITPDHLWDMFLGILHHCKHDTTFIVVDALDECHEGVAQLLRRIVSTGLHQPGHVKWLLTSRPLDVAEQILLAQSNQVLVSLEVNLDPVAQSVAAYVSYKVAELTKSWPQYPQGLQRRIEQELAIKAEGTFLWVSLMCRELQHVDVQDTLLTIEKAPAVLQAVLQAVYERAYTDLCKGRAADVAGCTQLLKIMMLAFRPLDVPEARHLIHLAADDPSLESWIERCASFVKIRLGETPRLVFIHQSARDYLAGLEESVSRNFQSAVDHTDMALRCLIYLTDHLTANLLQWPNGCAPREEILQKQADLPTGLGYPAEYWFTHIEESEYIRSREDALGDNGPVETFLRQRFLEWLEFLSLTDQLRRAELALGSICMVLLENGRQPPDSKSCSTVVQDAYNFVEMHRSMIYQYPLQLYSSALIFSPKLSEIRRLNMNQIPKWLRRTPELEPDHSDVHRQTQERFKSLHFSPRGQLIASINYDSTVNLWETRTGMLLRTIRGRGDSAVSEFKMIAFSPDGQSIALRGGDCYVINIWATQTGILCHTLRGHSAKVFTVAFSPNGQLLASGSYDQTVKVWDVQTGALQYTLRGHSYLVNSVIFSLDGRLIASGDDAGTIKLWQTQMRKLHQTVRGRTFTNSVVFSPDEHLIAASRDPIDRVDVWEVSEPSRTRAILAGVIGYFPEKKEIYSLTLSDPISRFCFSSDKQ